MTVLIAGTIGLDTIETPFGRKENILGGSAIHASMSASFWSDAALVSVAGSDFPEEHLQLLKSRGIDTSGIQILPGETFRWSGFYEYDMNQAHTRDTRLNVLLEFDPQLSPKFCQAEYIFLANLDPVLQLKIIDQLERPKFIALDTMNYWIENKRQELLEVIKRVDVILLNDGEARQFMDTPSLPTAAKRILELGVKTVIIKKGEHGALLFSANDHFSAPAYSQDKVIDPTGAGDSFAGGFIGYLANCRDTSPANLRRAIIVGSVMASFNVEDFSLNRLKSLTNEEIDQRFEMLRCSVEFGPLPKIARGGKNV